MSKARELLSSVRRRVAPRRYYLDPKQYWESRHDSFGNSLEGIGRLHMSEEDNRLSYESKWTKLEAALDALPAGTATLLDAGCGTGWFTQRFVDRGLTVTAVDFAKSGVDGARERVTGEVDWNVSDLASFHPGRTFDVVVCIDVLFHIVDDAIWSATVANLGALTAPGGRLIIQDHLVAESEVAPVAAPGTVHTRWRSEERYRAALPAAELLSNVLYEVQPEGAPKNLLTFALAPA